MNPKIVPDICDLLLKGVEEAQVNKTETREVRRLLLYLDEITILLQICLDVHVDSCASVGGALPNYKTMECCAQHETFLVLYSRCWKVLFIWPKHNFSAFFSNKTISPIWIAFYSGIIWIGKFSPLAFCDPWSNAIDQASGCQTNNRVSNKLCTCNWSITQCKVSMVYGLLLQSVRNTILELGYWPLLFIFEFWSRSVDLSANCWNRFCAACCQINKLTSKKRSYNE